MMTSNASEFENPLFDGPLTSVFQYYFSESWVAWLLALLIFSFLAVERIAKTIKSYETIRDFAEKSRSKEQKTNKSPTAEISQSPNYIDDANALHPDGETWSTDQGGNEWDFINRLFLKISGTPLTKFRFFYDWKSWQRLGLWRTDLGYVKTFDFRGEENSFKVRRLEFYECLIFFVFSIFFFGAKIVPPVVCVGVIVTELSAPGDIDPLVDLFREFDDDTKIAMCGISTIYLLFFMLLALVGMIDRLLKSTFNIFGVIFNIKWIRLWHRTPF